MGLNDSGSADRLPDSVATPEGDGEFDPTEPMTPAEVESSTVGMQMPRGGAPAAYEADKPAEGGLIDALDEISRGKIQP